MPTWVGSAFAETGEARTSAGYSGKGPGQCGYRGPAAYRKTGELTLRHIGSPDTGSGEEAQRFGVGG